MDKITGMSRPAAMLGAMLLAATLAHPAAAQQQLTVVGQGGALQDAERKAFFEPFASATGTKIIEDSYTGELAKVRAMVKSGNVTWDVLQLDNNALLMGCDEGILEKIRYPQVVNSSDFLEVGTHECGVGAFAWSKVIAFDSKRTPQGPKTWADFWDVTKFPGKRGLRSTARLTLEIALLADGVKPLEMYKVLSTPAGLDRAFRKMDELKPHIVWWRTGAEPIERLVAGDIAYTSGFNGRVEAANASGQNLKMEWDGQVLGIDYWGIVKGSPRKAVAEQFITFASRPEVASKLPEFIRYGVLNKGAIGLVRAEIRDDLPTSPKNLANALRTDAAFWAERGEEIEARFKVWQAK
ncbi:ABC transporter substrate-binding protein [Hyphomicrobium sp. CS1BSMeth3]|uniref:ABC transporter substrate-binding protein n=1 Tax=Hyphomicrobium sp. CS1BSMeth3 TaxID=1892844 RepID=UPI001574F840|nr:ABC transporter substrate-binding protein [Hyphomicrobium sp. CS1BSMeth3]